VIFESEKEKGISWHILHQHWYTCPIALPVRRNSQHRSLLTVVSATSLTPFQPLRHHRNFATFLDPAVNRFTQQTLPTVNRKYFLMNILCSETHNRTLLFGSAVLKHGRHFEYWNQTLNMRVCYLDGHESGRCCYLVIHIGKQLRILQLFYFHLLPIYWLLFLCLVAEVRH
jgi:hypothetical protein